MNRTPIQFQNHDTDGQRVDKLKRLAAQVADASKDSEIADLRRQLTALEARVAALESP
jgi:hypothetical protein